MERGPVKQRINLLVNSKLIAWGKEFGLNFSRVLERRLEELKHHNAKHPAERSEAVKGGIGTGGSDCPKRDLNPRRGIESIQGLESFYHWLLISRGLSDATAQDYRQDIGFFLDWSGHEIDRGLIEKYILELRGRELSPNTIRLRLIALRHYSNFLNRPDLTANIKAPKGPSRRRYNIPTFEQLNHAWRTLTGHNEKALFLLSLSTGLRRGELFSLKWKDVNFNKRVINVYHHTQTKRSAPWVFITEQCRDFLEGAEPENDFIIEPQAGYYSFTWRKVSKEAGIKLSSQALRVHFAVRARQAGLSDSVVNFLQGRRPANPLEMSYSPWTQQELEPLYEKVEPSLTLA